MSIKITPTDKYNRLVIKNETGCWGWSGRLTTRGYATFKLRGIRYVAHRFSYELHHGLILDKKVCHKCDNTVCSNPDHLFLGTNKDNTIDMMLKGRHNKAILTPSDVIEIRNLISKGHLSSTLAKQYGVSKQTIKHLKAGRTWKFV